MTPKRVSAVAQALRDVAALPNPVGEMTRGNSLTNGLQIKQVRVPMGVVGMIYEARPNVTVDVRGPGLKSGNAMILRGGSAAASTNAALVSAIRASLENQGLPADAVQLLDGGRDEVSTLIHRAWSRRPRHPARGSAAHRGGCHWLHGSGDRDRHWQCARVCRR